MSYTVVIVEKENNRLLMMLDASHFAPDCPVPTTREGMEKAFRDSFGEPDLYTFTAMDGQELAAWKAEQAAELKVGDVVTSDNPEAADPSHLYTDIFTFPARVDIIRDANAYLDSGQPFQCWFKLRCLRLATPAEIQQAHKGGAEG